MPSPGAPTRAGQRRQRPGGVVFGGASGGGGGGGQPASPGTCSPSIGTSLSGTRALPATASSNAARGSSGSSPEARDDLWGSNSSPSSADAAAAEEAAMAQAGSGSCGIGLPSMMIGDNLVISVVSGGCASAANASAASASAAEHKSAHNHTSTAAASSAANSSGNGQISGAGPISTNDGKSSTRPNKTNGNTCNNNGTHTDASNGTSSTPEGRSPRSRAQHNLLEGQEPVEEEEEGLFDWVGSSIQSAYDAMFPPTDEEGNANNGHANNGHAAPPRTAQTLEDGPQPPPSSSSTARTSTSRGVNSISSKKGNYLKSGGKSPVSFAAHTYTHTGNATSTCSSAAAANTPAQDDSSPVRATTSRTNRGYRRAQTAPPTSTSTSMSMSSPGHDHPSRRGSGEGTLQTAASMDSIDSRGRRRKKSSKLLLNRSSTTTATAAIRESLAGGAAAGKSRVAASLKMSRSRSDNNNNKGADERIGSGVGMAGEGTAAAPPSPSKAASFDMAAAGSRDEQDSGSGLRLPSLRPPLGPRLGNGWSSSKRDGGGTVGGGTISWTMMHDKLIDELFEASRRQYIATHFGGGEGGQNGHHHHHHLHEQPKEKEHKEHSGWKLGNLLSGGGGGGGNDADVVGGKSKKDKVDQTSADAGKGGGFRLPWSSRTDTKKKHRKRKRPKIFWRKKKKKKAASTSTVGAIGASLTSALAAAAAVATGGATSAKEENVTSPAPSKGKQGKVPSDPPPSTESTTSSPFLPRIGRFSPSKRKLSDRSLTDVHRSVTFAKGTAGPKRSIVRATGEYTGRQNPDPGTYLHPKCRLQKDKGRGEIPGNAICVVSREKALDKLRQKVDVIIEVEQSSSASTKAKLKLKQAVLNARAGEDDGMIETRSIISVKMGFLSMKYGILLRWDAETGLVNLIVLRKMCPTGFLTGGNGNAAITTDATDTPTKPSNGVSAKTIPAPVVQPPFGDLKKKSPSNRQAKPGLILGRLVDGANAILHGKGWDSDASAVGTEVAHLGPPYLVKRPESFADATLSVTVLRAEDLCAGDSRGSDWVMNPYVRLSIGAQTHRTRALKMTSSPTWSNTTLGDNSCRLAVSNNPRDDDQHLKVEVYDWRPLRRDRILGVVFVPVASVEPQKSSRNGAEPVSTEVTIPVRMMRNKKGPYAYVTLSLVHQNDHLCWLKEELKARGRD